MTLSKKEWLVGMTGVWNYTFSCYGIVVVVVGGPCRMKCPPFPKRSELSISELIQKILSS